MSRPEAGDFKWEYAVTFMENITVAGHEKIGEISQEIVEKEEHFVVQSRKHADACFVCSLIVGDKL